MQLGIAAQTCPSQAQSVAREVSQHGLAIARDDERRVLPIDGICRALMIEVGATMLPWPRKPITARPAGKVTTRTFLFTENRKCSSQ
jgi:hypothetical protein